MSTAATTNTSFDRLTLAAWTATAAVGTGFAVASQHDWLAIVIGSMLLAVTRLIRVPTPSGDMLDLGLAVAAAVPLLVHDRAAVGAIYAFGLLTSWLLLLGRRHAVRTMFVASALGLAAYGLVFMTTATFTRAAWTSEALADLVSVVAAGLAWFVTVAAIRAAATFGRQRFGFRHEWLHTLADWPVTVALVAAGALYAFAFPVLRWWTPPMVVMTYAFSHLAFVRYHDTRRTYGQTIRALARIPELAGLAPNGHSIRTANNALAMGRDLGLGPVELAELEYGALMHDIGRITLNEPAIIKAGYTDEDIARWGAEVISEAPYLKRVGDAVLQQHEPYRRPGEELDEDLPIASKIIKVASAYDQAVTDTGLDPLEAVEVLHRGAAYDFDPRMVRSLRRVLVRQGAIAY